MAINVVRKDVRFYPDSKRVIARFYMPGGEERANIIIEKVLAITERETRFILNQVLINFAQRHRNITRVFEKHCEQVEHVIKRLGVNVENLTQGKKLLIGSYFTMEYSIESAAFFNPSIVEDPDQTALVEGEKRVIVSFRATGEGHISSIVFRSGVIDKHNELHFNDPGDLVDIPEAVKKHVYDKKVFREKLHEMNIQKDLIGMVMDQLGDQFIYGELQASIANCMSNT